ncbi:MAG TPA: chemotaxis protein CheX [Acidobacteriaceae bacterium]|jgi:chemotaxis protein CheX|nr:chemotaxis protein CheX [Acidobacteriaceae bacterium]
MTALAVVEQELARLEGYLDRAMGEVFGTMMGVVCSQAGEVDPIEGQTVAALIGLAGALAGTVVVQCTRSGAMGICGSLTGVESTEVDETVRDAMGEVANMVAGAWKGYDPDLASRCLLSTPTVIVGSRYELFSRRALIRIDRGYRFGEHLCAITISCQRAG